MKSMFKQSSFIFGIKNISFEFNEDKKPVGMVNFSIKDHFKIERVNDQVKLFLSRELIGDEDILKIKVEVFDVRTLNDKNITTDEIMIYLNNNHNEMAVDYAQISTIIANITLLTPFRGIVTNPQYLEK